MVSYRDGTWAVVDRDGRFDTNNPEGIRGLHWIFPENPFRALSIELFMREYYEPRLLARILAGEKLPPVTLLQSLDRRQPGVRIVKVTPQPGAPQQVGVTVEVTAPKGAAPTAAGKTAATGVFDLRLFRDGQLVGYAPRNDGRIAVDPKTGTAVVQLAGIKLPSGTQAKSVEFTAYAFNRDRIKSATHRFAYAMPQGAAPARGRAYVITLAVASNQNPKWALVYPDRDARRIQAALLGKLKQTGKYAEVVSVPLVSDYEEREGPPVNRPTKANIKTAFDMLAGKPVSPERLKEAPATGAIKPARPDDLVLIAFSGHGYADTCGNFFLLPYNTGIADDETAAALRSRCIPASDRSQGFTAALLERAISDKELSLWARDVDAGDLVMIVDACHSAAAVEGEGFKPGPMGSRGLGQLSYDKGMQILAASQINDVARAGGRFDGSVLLEALLKDGLDGWLADFGPVDGRITMEEWLAYGSERVPNLFAERFPDRKDAPQKPSLFDFARQRPEVLLAEKGK